MRNRYAIPKQVEKFFNNGKRYTCLNSFSKHVLLAKHN